MLTRQDLFQLSSALSADTISELALDSASDPAEPLVLLEAAAIMAMGAKKKSILSAGSIVTCRCAANGITNEGVGNLNNLGRFG